MAPALEGIDHIHVYVGDRDAAEQWYARVLGLHRMPEFEYWAVDGGPLTLADASGAVHLALFERTPMQNRSTVALRVSATAFIAWQAHVRAELGHDVEIEDHVGSWSMYFADPDGNPYEITSYDVEAIAAALGPEAGG